jgi:hypothetical protein
VKFGSFFFFLRHDAAVATPSGESNHCFIARHGRLHSSPLRFCASGSAHFGRGDCLLALLAFAFASAARILILLALELFCSYDGAFQNQLHKMLSMFNTQGTLFEQRQLHGLH